MVKNLSCVSCGSLKRFLHTFTNDRRPVGAEEAEGGMVPPFNPISTGGGGADYAHYIITCHPGFLYLPKALHDPSVSCDIS